MYKTPRMTLRFDSEELRKACEERAEEKDISLNEWVNRALKHAVARGGEYTETRTVRH